MSDRTTKPSPSTVEWSALDLYRVKDAAAKLRVSPPDISLAEDFCRALRQSRSDWEYFEQRMPGQFHEAGRWLAALSRDVLTMLDSPKWKSLKAKTSEVRKSGISRHLEILLKAMEPARHSRKRQAA